MERFKDISGRLGNFWKSLGKGQRWTLAGSAAGLMILFSILLFYSGRVNYVPLFSGLELDDQAAIVDLLKEQGVQYRIDPNASAILVPEESVYNLRLTMASSGLPRNSTVGYEIFDDTKMGMTDFQQQVAYVRAIEGELARTISRLDVVESARVNVVLPKQKLFLKEEQPATASILVKLRPGRQMQTDQIKAVLNLVASSVEGLTTDNVSMVDTSGRLLSEMVGDGYFLYQGATGGVSSVQREMERQQEIDLEKKLQNMLSAIFGPGNSVVRVKVELDFTRLSRKKQEYVPEARGKGVVRSIQTTEETFSGTSQANNGVGTASNIPGYAVKTSGSNNGDYNKTDQIINYEISSLEQEEQKAPGTVKRITASVVINSDETSVQRDQLLYSLSTAIGIDEERGDLLSLAFMPFASADQVMDGFAPLPEEKFQLSRILVPIAGLAAVLAVAGIVILFLRRRKKAGNELVDAVQQEGQETNSADPGLWNIPKNDIQILEEQLGLYTENYPEEAASIVKKWLEES